ncbi:MAG: hypothetical protein ACI9P9_000629 [Patescibacteria group bacterium]
MGNVEGHTNEAQARTFLTLKYNAYRKPGMQISGKGQKGTRTFLTSKYNAYRKPGMQISGKGQKGTRTFLTSKYNAYRKPGMQISGKVGHILSNLVTVCLTIRANICLCPGYTGCINAERSFHQFQMLWYLVLGVCSCCHELSFLVIPT